MSKNAILSTFSDDVSDVPASDISVSPVFSFAFPSSSMPIVVLSGVSTYGDVTFSGVTKEGVRVVFPPVPSPGTA